MKRKYLLITMLFFLLYPCVGFCLNTGIVDSSMQASVITEKTGEVDVSIFVTKIPREYPYSKTVLWGGCEENASLPRKTINAIVVMKNKQQIFIPFSAYADLGDPGSIELKKVSAQEFQLTIIGGDAGSSYKATLVFKDNEIFSRKVVSGEFPEDAWEETRYKFNHLNN